MTEYASRREMEDKAVRAKMRVYVAGPMESVGGNMNEPLFDYVVKKLRDTGYCEVFSPIELTRELIGPIKTLVAMDKQTRKENRRGLLKKEFAWICDNADVMFLLPNWEQSPGARAEKAVAEALGIQVREADNVLLPTSSELDSMNKKAHSQNLQTQDER